MVVKKNRDIQCLRAIAILLVMMQHYRGRLPTPDAYAQLFNYFAFWPGVDVFFAISGYLICQTFLRDLDSTNSTLTAIKEFWNRRFRRLFPAVTFWCTASIAISFFTKSASHSDPNIVATSAASALAGLSNLYWAVCVQTSGACGSADFNGVTWSLSLEWQLYALLTFLICTVGQRWAVALMLCAAVAMAFFHGPIFSYIWAFRLQAFTLGALTHLVLASNFRNVLFSMSRPVLTLMLVIGLLLCIISPTKLSEPFVLPSIAVGALLCLLSSLSDKIFSQSILTKPFLWLGERSYSVYLCHLPAFLIVHELLFRSVGLTATPGTIFMGITLAACCIYVFSELSYRFIEIPFQRVTQKIVGQQAMIPSR